MSRRFLGLILCKSFPFPSSIPSPPTPFSHFKFFFCNSSIDLGTLPSSGSAKVGPFTNQDFSFLNDCTVVDNSNPSKFSADALSVSNAINKTGNVFEFNTQKCLRQYRDRLNESLVIDVLKLVKNPQLGVQFFIWAAQQVGYSHTTPVYDALLGVMGLDKNDRIPESFLRDIGDDDREVLGKLLNVLVRKCCLNGMWNLALEELGRLKDFGYRPGSSTYNALVRVFLEAGRLDTARLLHREMLDAGVKMEVSNLDRFVYALCKDGKWREAAELLEKEEFVPDTRLYTTMISGLCEASLFDEAMDILDKMRCGSSLPNVITYRVLLCGCLKKRKLGRCKRVLSMMMAEGCYPSRKIFNSLVHAYCTAGEFSYAYKLLKKMEKCGCQPGYLVYNILIGGICGREELLKLEELELAEKAFAEMLNLGLVLNKINVSSFSKCLCEAGKFDKAYSVIHEMASKGFVPDCSTYSKVIEFLCNGSQMQRAFLLFEEMKRSGIVPDVYVYTILIDGFCKAGLIVQARKWFDEMVRSGCSPNVVTYTALIHAYLKAQKTNDADELYEMMVSNGCVPNIVTYTALIDGYCKTGNIDKACQIYARMRGQENSSEVDLYFKGNPSETSKPNVFTYGALVDGLCKAHKVSDASSLLDAMLGDGCEPNHIVYDALIDGFCKAGKLDKAQEVLVTMSARGYNPNEHTYGSLIDRMFKDKRLDLAMKVISKMLENNCAPNVVIYTEMIDGLCKAQKLDEAYKLMLMMDKKGCHPNVVTYTAMIDGLGRTGKVDKCLDLLKEMHDRSCAPNYVTYRVLINHCCSFGFLDEAYNLLEEMKRTYWPIHMASYQKVIEGFNQEFITSLGLLDVLSDDDKLVPIAPIYKVLVDSFCKAGRLEKAAQLCREMSAFASCHVVADLYSSLIRSLCLVSRVDEGFRLFAEMARNGAVLEPSVFFHLILGLIKLDRWDEALQISHNACLMGINWAAEEMVQSKQ